MILRFSKFKLRLTSPVENKLGKITAILQKKKEFNMIIIILKSLRQTNRDYKIQRKTTIKKNIF